jgi:hypothetical protein
MTGGNTTSAEQNAEFFARAKHARDVAELDFGVRWPTALTPARAVVIVGRKTDRG